MYKMRFFSGDLLVILNEALQEEGYPPTQAGYGLNIQNRFNDNEKNEVALMMVDIVEMPPCDVEMVAMRVRDFPR